MPEGPIEKYFRLVARDGDVLVVELELPVNVSEVHVVEHAALLLHLGVQRSARYRRVQHELVEIRAVRDRVFDLLMNVLGRVVLEAHDGRTQYLDTDRKSVV